MIRKYILAACAALSFGGAATAGGPITVKFTGTVTNAQGAWVLLGQRAQDYAGAGFEAMYVFNPTLGSSTPGMLYGGSENGLANPALSVTLTFNGASLKLSGADFGELSAQQDASGSRESAITRGTDASGLYFQVYNTLQDSSAGYGSPFFTNWDGDVSGGLVNEGDIFIQDMSGAAIDLGLHITHLTVTNGSVPEPTSWAMMVAGFGMAGAALRMRRTPAFA